MKLENQINIRNSIATRLLRIVFSFYIVIAIGVTLIHMIMEYRYQKDNISRDLENIQRTFERGLAIDLWQMNQESLSSTVEGMLEIPVIVGVKIQDENGVFVAVGGIIAQGEDIGNVGRQVNLLGLNQEESKIHEDEKYKLDVFMHRFPIVYTYYEEETKQLGEATIYSNTSVVFRRVKLGFLLLVINAVLKTTALWLIFLWFSTFLLRKPLSALASATRNVSLENLDSFKVKIETSGRNELKVLEKSFNSMIGNLHKSIVEREHAEEKMRESEERFRTLVTNVPGVSYRCACDEHWTMEFISDEVETLSGYPVADFIQNRIRSYASIIHPDDVQMVEDAVMEGVGREETFPIEYRIVRADGGVRWVYEKGLGVFSENGDLRFLDGVIIDITERKRAEEELARYQGQLEDLVKERTKELETAQKELIKSEKLAVLGRIIATVSHELRNPLGVIRTSIFYLNKKLKKVDQKTIKHMNRIDEQIEQCDSIIKNLMEYSKGSRSVVFPIDFNSFLNEMTDRIISDEQSDIFLNSNFSSELPSALFDEEKMKIVLKNIFKTANHAK